MGGGAMHIDLPIFHVKPPPPPPPSNGENRNSNNVFTRPVSPSYVSPVKPPCSDSYCFCGSETCRKLEAVNRKGDKRAGGSLLSSVFGPVPSQFEVQNATAALLNFMQGIISSQTELPWLRQILDCRVTRNSLSYRRVYDAFQLLQTDPCVKRLVVSLSSDKALWDAVTNNELVRKLREPFSSASGLPQPESSNEEPELAARIMRWIMDITKAKVMELIETFQSLVNEMFLLPPEAARENPTAAATARATADNKDQFEEKVRSSLLLCVVILLIVVVTRFQGGRVPD